MLAPIKFALALALLWVASQALMAESACPLQLVIVNVRNNDGTFVDNLPPTAFHATGHGLTITTLSATSVATPQRVVLVFDASGSMSSGSKLWRGTKLMADQIVQTMPASTRMGFIAFASRPLTTLDFSHSRTEIRAAIEQLTGSRDDVRLSELQTSLWDALLKASDLLGDTEPGDSVIVISDGRDNHSKAREQDVERVYMRRGIRLFAVAIQAGALLSEEERLGAESLVTFARATGAGTAVDAAKFHFDLSPTDPALLQQILRQISDEVAHFYVLKLSESAGTRNPERWHLEIVGENNKRRKGLTLTYPQRILPCPRLEPQ
jgi:hypothetical protein